MWFKFLVVGIMVFIKALFSASDTAFTYINKAKISQLSKKNGKAKKIKHFLEEKNKFYGIIEVVITMIELLSSAYVAEVFVGEFGAKLELIGLVPEVAIMISIIIITLILSYFLLIFGGILPKQIARNYPEKTAFTLINLLWIVSRINYPFEWLVRKSTKLFSKIFKIEENPKDKLTEKEIKMIIMEGKDQGVIDKIEKEIVFNALKFEEISVSNIMIKREDIDFINIKDSNKKIFENIKKNKYTRMPVYSGDINNIIGLFNIKDVIIDYSKEKEIDVDLKSHLREVLYATKNEKISTIFKKMQNKKIHMVIVLDENQKVIGMLTMEDILERLVGKIFDEYEERK